MSFSAHIDKKKDILVLGKGPTQGLEHTLTAEKCIPLILLWLEKMEQIVTYFLMVHKFTNLKQKILKLYQVQYV